MSITRVLSPRQVDAFHQSTARLNIAHGPVRSGKSVALEVWRWAQYVRTAPPGDLLMAARTLKALERNVLRPLQDVFGSKHVQYSLGNKRALLFRREVELEGANDERAEAKIRGMTLAGALTNEVTLLPESFFRQVLARMSAPGAQLFGTTNPDGPFHWLKRDFLDREPNLNLRQWVFRLDDNTFLDPAYVEALKAEYTGLWYRRFILGQWCAAEGAIYDMFDESRHVVDSLPTIRRTWCAIDYGTSGTTSMLLIGEGEDRCLYVMDESTWNAREKGRQRTDKEHAEEFERFTERHRIERTFIDPSAASFILQLSKLRVKGLVPADNRVLDGIRNVASLLSADRLKFHRRCKNTLREMRAYAWDPKAQVQGEDRPIKADDHHVDSLRYGIRMIRSVWAPWLGFQEEKRTDRLLPSQIANARSYQQH